MATTVAAAEIAAVVPGVAEGSVTAGAEVTIAPMVEVVVDELVGSDVTADDTA